MEKRDLYDANFNLTGKTIEKNEEIPKNITEEIVKKNGRNN